MARAYHIADEPQPNDLARYAVSPQWCFLAEILGGSWIGLPWFLFNGYAVGSATRKEEMRTAATSVVASLVFAFVAFNLIDALHVEPVAWVASVTEGLGMPGRSYAYAWVVIIAIKCWFTYRLVWLQSKSVDIHQSYGGKLLNGAAVAGAAYLLRGVVLSVAGKISVWLFVVLF